MIIAIVFQHLKNLKDILDLLSPVLRSVIYILTYLVGIPFLFENDGNRDCFFFFFPLFFLGKAINSIFD